MDARDGEPRQRHEGPGRRLRPGSAVGGLAGRAGPGGRLDTFPVVGTAPVVLADRDGRVARASAHVLLLYLADVADHPRRLWCDESLTPHLACFCQEGLESANAVGTTPVLGSKASLAPSFCVTPVSWPYRPVSSVARDGPHKPVGYVLALRRSRPLYMSWPAGSSGGRRVVDEPVSDIDLAPTRCDLAGCTLPEVDGLSLVPLIRGETDRLERPFIYVENLHRHDDVLPWYGLYTTHAYADTEAWVYTELATGERELYDLVADPQQLRNLAREPEQAARLEELHSMLHEGVIEPDGVEYLDR